MGVTRGPLPLRVPVLPGEVAGMCHSGVKARTALRQNEGHRRGWQTPHKPMCITGTKQGIWMQSTQEHGSCGISLTLKVMLCLQVGKCFDFKTILLDSQGTELHAYSIMF